MTNFLDLNVQSASNSTRRVMDLLDDADLGAQIKALHRLDLSNVRALTLEAMKRHTWVDPIGVHSIGDTSNVSGTTYVYDEESVATYLHADWGDADNSNSSLDAHQRLLSGLPGEALVISAALLMDSFTQAEDHFGLTLKTLKARLGKSLDAATGEQALRASRATLAAAEVFGGLDAARQYMHTRNFALGGATPADLIRTAEGEQIVLNELQTQAECGPL